jgi:hypothetical protein
MKKLYESSQFILQYSQVRLEKAQVEPHHEWQNPTLGRIHIVGL